MDNLQKIVRSVIREKLVSNINEASYTDYNLGKVQYTDKNMTPADILNLAMAYTQTGITKIVGAKHDYRIRAANDLAKLTGGSQLQPGTKSGKKSLISYVLQNKLVSKDEYVKLYKDLIAKHIEVLKYLKKSSPEMRNSSAASRAAAKDARGEFGESVNEASKKIPLFIPNVGNIDDYKLKSLLQKNPKVKTILGDKEFKFLNKDNTDVIMVSGKPYNSITTDGELEFELDLKKNILVKPLGKARPKIIAHYSKNESVNEGAGTLTIEKRKDGKYYWQYKFKSGKIEDWPEGFNTKADAQKDFMYRSKYIKEAILNEDTNRANILGIDFNISEMNGKIFFSFIDKKAAYITIRKIGTNKIVNHIQKSLDNSYGKGEFFFKSGSLTELQPGYLFQRTIGNINLNKLKFESVNEGDENSPEEILSGLREMAFGDLERIADYANMIETRMKEGQELDSWMYSQITLAVDQLNSVHDTMDGRDGEREPMKENADYKYLTKIILDANPKHNVYYNDSWNVVNIGGTGYDKGDLSKQFNQTPGSASTIKNNFYYANQDPQKTKREIEKLSNGKIKVNINKGIVYYSLDESVNEEKPGLWANIRAKKARGEKPAHGNSDAHKDAVKAGKEINKEGTLTEKKYYVTYNKGRGQGKGLETVFDKKAFKTTDKPMVFSSYKDAKKYAEDMERMFKHSIGGGTAYWVSDEKMNPIKETITEKQFKGIEGIPANKKLSQLSDAEKIKIVQASGNIIDFMVPDWAKGTRNFWQVISKGSIKKKKNLGGDVIYFLPGKMVQSPAYTSVKELLNGIDWESMEERRRFNESVTNVTEMSTNDVHFKNILRMYDSGGSFTKKKVAVVVCNDSNATRTEIIDAMKEMDYEDISDAQIKLGISKPKN
jgi:hypothetical protein